MTVCTVRGVVNDDHVVVNLETLTSQLSGGTIFHCDPSWRRGAYSRCPSPASLYMSRRGLTKRHDIHDLSLCMYA